MKIRIKDFKGSPAIEDDVVEIDVGAREVELQGVFNGVGIPCDQGYIGIAQRDAGIEVMLDGKLLWSSTSGEFKD